MSAEAIDRSAQLQSAVRRLMSEHGSNQRSDALRFTAGIYRAGWTFINDDDFLYDSSFRLEGDFGDDETRLAYTQAVCDVLNAAIAASDSPTERSTK